jgi:hypothetical protein
MLFALVCTVPVVAVCSKKGKICDVMQAPWHAKGDNATEDTAAVLQSRRLSLRVHQGVR